MPPSRLRWVTMPRTLPSASITGPPESPRSTGTEMTIAWRGFSPSSASSVPVRLSRPRRTAGSFSPRAGPSRVEPTPKPIVTTGVPELEASSSGQGRRRGRADPDQGQVGRRARHPLLHRVGARRARSRRRRPPGSPRWRPRPARPAGAVRPHPVVGGVLVLVATGRGRRGPGCRRGAPGSPASGVATWAARHQPAPGRHGDRRADLLDGPRAWA